MASSLCQTHYEILGITQQAQLKEVRDAYHKLALKCHPDKDPGNPGAVAVFQKLGAAYETLSDENRRTQYDATLSSSQRARQRPQPANWPPQKSSDPDVSTRTWHEDRRSRAWDSFRDAQERADQARRDDDAFWSGPTYAHGATDSSGWGKSWHWEQKDRYDLFEHKQRQRKAREEARKEAERKKRHMNKPPSPRDPFDQSAEERTAQGTHKKKQEAREKAERERREDHASWGTPPSPQQSYRDWSNNIEKEYQERLENEKKERADRRKAEREQYQKEWAAELPLLLSKIMSVDVDIDQTKVQADESKRATKDEREDEDQEQIFDLPIKRKSLERRLKEYLDQYKRIVKSLRDQGQEKEANKAIVKLQEARDGRTSRKEGSRREQAEPRTKTKTKAKAEKDRGKPSTNTEDLYPDHKSNSRQSSKPSIPRGDKRSSAEQPHKTTLPMSDGRNDEDVTRQQQSSREYMANPRVSYDDSDPDRGFTEHVPEPWIAGEDYDYDDEDYDPPFSNDFHDSHMEVHREFWDIIDSWQECNFCRKVCTVMRCPKCDITACAYCKNSHG